MNITTITSLSIKPPSFRSTKMEFQIGLTSGDLVLSTDSAETRTKWMNAIKLFMKEPVSPKKPYSLSYEGSKFHQPADAENISAVRYSQPWKSNSIQTERIHMDEDAKNEGEKVTMDMERNKKTEIENIQLINSIEIDRIKSEMEEEKFQEISKLKSEMEQAKLEEKERMVAEVRQKTDELEKLKTELHLKSQEVERMKSNKNNELPKKSIEMALIQSELSEIKQNTSINVLDKDLNEIKSKIEQLLSMVGNDHQLAVKLSSTVVQLQNQLNQFPSISNHSAASVYEKEITMSIMNSLQSITRFLSESAILQNKSDLAFQTKIQNILAATEEIANDHELFSKNQSI